MFNTTTNLKINACSGGIYKTYLESWFEKFHLNSSKANELLRRDQDKDYYSNSRNKVILQMVICGDMEVIAEIIEKEDLEKYLNNKED